MKAKNHEEIRNGYLEFSAYLASCVAIGVLAFYIYLQNSNVEFDRITVKTAEYDKTYVRQSDLVGRIDSLYQYMLLFNTNRNDAALQNVISKRKQEILLSMEDMNTKDVKIHHDLMNRINTFLGAKDSIRLLKIEEDLIRNDLKKCIDENKKVSQRLTSGNITQN